MSASNSLGTIQGLTTIQSSFDPKATIDRLEAQIQARGLNVFSRIDHAAGAAETGMQLAPTYLIIFGNAQGGTPLMQSVQTVGIDLPLKVLVWQDAANNTWVSYNEPSWIAQRHAVANRQSAIDKLGNVISTIAREAAGDRYEK
jgi:uncharacterized protein (DUF302 family)